MERLQDGREHLQRTLSGFRALSRNQLIATAVQLVIAVRPVGIRAGFSIVISTHITAKLVVGARSANAADSPQRQKRQSCSPCGHAEPTPARPFGGNERLVIVFAERGVGPVESEHRAVNPEVGESVQLRQACRPLLGDGLKAQQDVLDDRDLNDPFPTTFLTLRQRHRFQFERTRANPAHNHRYWCRIDLDGDVEAQPTVG